jgi:hypothetical protein
MTRGTKSRSHRKSKHQADTNGGEARSLDPVKMRRYLAFVRAVVGASAKGGAR